MGDEKPKKKHHGRPPDPEAVPQKKLSQKEAVKPPPKPPEPPKPEPVKFVEPVVLAPVDKPDPADPVVAAARKATSFLG